MKLLRYPAIIARLFEKIKTPVTIRMTPVIIETTRIYRLALLKKLRKILMASEVRRKGMASPAE